MNEAAAAEAELLLKYDGRVPRYTSYPTANRFHGGIGPADYASWLGGTDAGDAVALYLHVPFCDTLCWYCGCHTQVVRHADLLAAYGDLLSREIDLVADLLPGRLTARAVHWGGGTPSLLGTGPLAAVMRRVTARFAVAAGAEIAIELDPRVVDEAAAEGLATLGVNRVSLGVQDFDERVQAAINRRQSFDQTARVVHWLGGAGIARINVDLVYGLPHQTVDGVRRTAAMAAGLGVQRFAVFGYAHVPWMQKRQQLIDEGALPGAMERLAMFEAVADELARRGYRRIGLDHFALPDDELALAARNGGLHRNFQGYTAVPARTVIGFGASAIGMLPQGFVQNTVALPAYRQAIEAARLATARGIALQADDRMVAEAIERLMCDFAVDLEAVAARHGEGPDAFDQGLAALAPLAADGIVAIKGRRVRVTRRGMALVRNVCAAFDRYLLPGGAAAVAHARAI
jgi:oxygen-independent coproporphyrinogen-3 oxidase